MTADIVNLRRFRKAKARAEKDATAAANRVRFGRSKAERLEQDAERGLADRRLDGARRAPEGSSPARAPEGSSPARAAGVPAAVPPPAGADDGGEGER